MKRILYIFFLSLPVFFLLLACGAQPNADEPLPIIPVAPLTPASAEELTPQGNCTTIVTQPTPEANDASSFPPISAADFSFGAADAPITIVEYCDFQSTSCRVMSDSIAKLMKSHDNVRFVFRPLPLVGMLDKSDKAVVAALAAAEQDKFWTMYDFLFVTYASWEALQPDEFYAWVIRESEQTGIDPARLESAINDPATTTRMMSLYEAAKKANIPAVPLVLINGSVQQSYITDYQILSEMVDLIALGQKQLTACPPFDINAQKQYIATIQTEKGDIVMQLFPDKAPLAVNSFVFLARQKWYDGVTFHRVIPGFVAQTGDPSGTGKGNPGYFFNSETNDLLFDKPGMVAMENSGPDTNGSQFFITFAPAPQIDGSYTIFGQVINGLDVVENLTPRDALSGVTPPGDKIISIDIVEK